MLREQGLIEEVVMTRTLAKVEMTGGHAKQTLKQVQHDIMIVRMLREPQHDLRTAAPPGSPLN